jgi:hypothetical protein
VLPEAELPLFANESDAELEWLLCLASAMQAGKDQKTGRSAERTAPRKANFHR